MELALNESHNNNRSLKFISNEIIKISKYGKAIHDYSGRAEDELTFEEEDVIYLSLKDETGDWVFGELNGSRGWFPSSNIKVLTEKECISEGINWPPQSSIINNSTSSSSIKSSSKDLSMSNIRNRCNSKDSSSSSNSNVQITNVIVPTTNEDASNPTLPPQHVRSWFSKYQQIKRYQPKRGPNSSYQSKVGNSTLNFPPSAASNLSERNIVMSDEERKAELTYSILSSGTNNSLPKYYKDKNELLSQKVEEVHNNNNDNNNNNNSNNNNNNNNNSNNNNNIDNNNNINDNDKPNEVYKKDSITKESFNNDKYVNEFENTLNNDSNKIINSEDKIIKEENGNHNSNINRTAESLQDSSKENDNDNSNENNKTIQFPTHSNTLNAKDTSTESKKGHHNIKINGSQTLPSRIIHRVNTPTFSRQKWSDFVSGLTMENLNKKEIQRQEVIFEMIATEKDYLKDLGIVSDIYIKPMKDMKIIRPKDIDVIFSDWEIILKVHEEIMRRLDDRQKQGYIINEIGDIWVKMSDYLRVYTMYCSNHPYALIKLQNLSRNKTFTKFLESRLQLPESRNLNLANFLLKPVQRICKYPLLLREIIKSTDEDHPDYKNLVSALCKIETVITVINDAAKQTEGVHKLLELQQRFTTKVSIVASLRTIVHKSEIEILEKRLNSYDKKKRQMYLLNDMVLLARSTSNGPDSLNTGKLKLIAMISTKEILVKDLEDTPLIKNAFELVHTGKQSYKISVDTPLNKEVWLKMLNNVILNDVQSSKVDSVTAMKPSIETTYQSLNGRSKKKFSPKTQDYKLSALKFGDANANKEVEIGINKISSKNNISDNDEESNRDEERSFSSSEMEDNNCNISNLFSINNHNSNNEMPSISEGVVSNFEEIKSNSNCENLNSNSIINEKEDNNEGKEKINNAISIKGKERSKNLLLDNEEMYDLEVCRDSRSFEYEGSKESFFDDDEEYKIVKNKKRHSYPFMKEQLQRISQTNVCDKDKGNNSLIPDEINSSVASSNITKRDNEIETESVSIKSGIQKTNSEETSMVEEKSIIDKNINENEEDHNKNMINSLNDVLDNYEVSNEKKEGEDNDDLLQESSLKRKTKFYSSLENMKNLNEHRSNSPTPSVHSEPEDRINNESTNLHNSISNGSLVINNEKEERGTFSRCGYSNSNEDLLLNNNKCWNKRNEENFSFNKLRSMFGNLANSNCISDFSINLKEAEENNERKEELKNVILPSKIHNIQTPTKRGFIVNPLVDVNKSVSCDSPTRFMYDISKNPFIIKDISYKSVSKNNSDYQVLQNSNKPSSTISIPRSKVSSIQKGLISKSNEENTNSSCNKYMNELNSHNMTGNVENKRKSFRNDTIIKSPLAKEIQFDELNNNCNVTDKKDKLKENTNNTHSGLITTADVISDKIKSNSLSVVDKNVSNGKSSIAITTPANNVKFAALSTKSVSFSAFSHRYPLVSKDFISPSNSSTLKKGQTLNISKPVNSATIIGVENIIIESLKKYVYVIQVDRGPTDISIVHHTYDDFFDLHLQLIGNFPEEAGVSIGFFNKNNTNKVTRRIIPDLPAQMMFVSEAIAKSRIIGLQEYINTILKLPGKISKHPLVMNFFKMDGKWSASVYSNKK